jgi:hypothetical protein
MVKDIGVNHRVMNLVTAGVLAAQAECSLVITLDKKWRAQAVDGRWVIYDFEAGPLDCFLNGRHVKESVDFITQELAAQLEVSVNFIEGLFNGLDGCSKYHAPDGQARSGYATGQALAIWAEEHMRLTNG